MHLAAGSASPVAAPPSAASLVGRPLDVQTVGVDAATPGATAYRDGQRSLRRFALVHVLAGLAYAVVFTIVWMTWVTPGFVLTRALWFLAVYAWPVVIVLGLVAAASQAGRFAIAGGYAAVVLAVAGYALARNPGLAPGELVTFWLTASAPETVLVLAFLVRRLRAVGPLVLAFVTAGVTGALFGVQLAGVDENVLRNVADVGFAAGLGATGVFVAMHVVGFVVLAVISWFALRWLARRYQRKLLSDQTLVVYAVVLVFAVGQSIPLVFSGWALILTGVAAFVAYVAVSRVGCGILVAPGSAAHGPMLLLLRVFALGARSQRLFDTLSTRWLRVGSIALIAGPDLVTAIVEPHEFLDFVAGRLSRRFVRGSADLERRLAEVDTEPDRDGRFRTNEFFCHADTWQETMRRLAGRCDGVLMDLRGFAPSNAGCLYEIGQLLDGVPLGRVVFLVDETTDAAFLRSTFARLWAAVPPGSPNRRLEAPRVTLFSVQRASERAIGGLLRLLLATRPDGGVRHDDVAVFAS
jgi:hypothetical protein